MGMYTLNVQLYSAVFSAGIGRVDMIMLGKRPLNPADPSSGYPRLTTEQSFKLATPFSNGRADGAPGGGGGQRGGGHPGTQFFLANLVTHCVTFPR